MNEGVPEGKRKDEGVGVPEGRRKGSVYLKEG